MGVFVLFALLNLLEWKFKLEGDLLVLGILLADLELKAIYSFLLIPLRG